MSGIKIGFINWNWPNKSCEGCKHFENGNCTNMPIGDELSYDEEGVYCNIYHNKTDMTENEGQGDENGPKE